MPFHITDNGPKPCSAKPGNCPITKDTEQEHYQTIDEAQKAYEETMKEKNLSTLSQLSDNYATETKSKNKLIKFRNLPKTVLSASVKPQKGGSYYGSKIPAESIEKYREAWIAEVGEEQAELMEKAKIERDGGYHFHITALTPKETRTLFKEGKKKGIDVRKNLSEILVPQYEFKGVGTVKDEENNKEAWYIVVESFNLDEWRERNNLPKKDYHITLGFVNGDVHTMLKDSETLRIV